MSVFRICIKGCLIFAALVVLAVGALAFRLSMGPIEVSFLGDYIEKGLSAANGSFRVKSKTAVIEWRGWDHGLQVVLRDVQVRRSSKATIASLPNVAITLDAGSLVTGEVAPRKIVVQKPTLLLRRSATGQITLGVRQKGKA